MDISQPDTALPKVGDSPGLTLAMVASAHKSPLAFAFPDLLCSVISTLPSIIAHNEQCEQSSMAQFNIPQILTH